MQYSSTTSMSVAVGSWELTRTVSYRIVEQNVRDHWINPSLSVGGLSCALIQKLLVSFQQNTCDIGIADRTTVFIDQRTITCSHLTYQQNHLKHQLSGSTQQSSAIHRLGGTTIYNVFRTSFRRLHPGSGCDA